MSCPWVCLSNILALFLSSVIIISCHSCRLYISRVDFAPHVVFLSFEADFLNKTSHDTIDGSLSLSNNVEHLVRLRLSLGNGLIRKRIYVCCPLKISQLQWAEACVTCWSFRVCKQLHTKVFDSDQAANETKQDGDFDFVIYSWKGQQHVEGKVVYSSLVAKLKTVPDLIMHIHVRCNIFSVQKEGQDRERAVIKQTSAFTMSKFHLDSVYGPYALDKVETLRQSLSITKRGQTVDGVIANRFLKSLAINAEISGQEDQVFISALFWAIVISFTNQWHPWSSS